VFAVGREAEEEEETEDRVGEKMDFRKLVWRMYSEIILFMPFTLSISAEAGKHFHNFISCFISRCVY
jgi:hypothetical protein